jgi:hypothetical protein
MTCRLVLSGIDLGSGRQTIMGVVLIVNLAWGRSAGGALTGSTVAIHREALDTA